MFKTINTLLEAQDFVISNAGNPQGVICPCCERLTKIYKRKFNAGMACALIYIYRIAKETDGDWIHVTEQFVKKFKVDATKLDYNKLAYFGLIKQKHEKVEGKKDSGYWKITKKGVMVAKGLEPCERYASILNGDLLSLSEEKIYIKNALSDKFDYDELMSLGGR